MSAQNHHQINKQTLKLSIDSESQALQLQSRLSDINQQQLLPIMARVFDELDIAGQQIHIDTLTVDLGFLSFNRFEQQLTQRFEQALRQALQASISSIASIKTEQVSLCQLFEYYLLHGTLPWYAHQHSQFNCDVLFMTLVSKNQSGLVALINRQGHRGEVIERIVSQLSESSLCRLLSLLQPQQGALIIAYLFDLQRIHLQHYRRRHYLLSMLDGPTYRRLLWLLALSFTLNQRGSQFNRRSFVKSLLEGIARSEGVGYGSLLAMLNLGLSVKSGLLHSSLAAVIALLMQQLMQQRAKTVVSEQQLSGRLPNLLIMIVAGEQIAKLLLTPKALPTDLSQWQVSQLQALLVYRLQSGQHSSAAQANVFRPSAVELLQVLVTRHRHESRALMIALYQPPMLAGELLSHSPPALVDDLLDVLQPNIGAGISAVLKALMAVLAGIGAPYRPRLGDLRRVIVGEALHLRRPVGEDFFARVLRQLFPGSLAEPLKRQLSVAADGWAGTAGLSAAVITDFKAVINGDTPIPSKPSPSPSLLSPAIADRHQPADKDNGIYVDNAGLVLLAVFLPHLFNQLQMLNENGLRDSATVTRAVHLLQYLVDGCTTTAEPLLALNKLLCGVPLNCVVQNAIVISAAEVAICQQLLNAVIVKWGSIEGTSVAGLQQTFLQRQGRLLKTAEGWRLTVQRKTLDVLVDQIPWRIAVVSPSWMTTTLTVKW